MSPQDFEKALQDANKCIELKPTWGKVSAEHTKLLMLFLFYDMSKQSAQ